MPPTTVWSLSRMTTARGRLWLGPALLSLYSTNGATINFRTSSSATSVSVRVYSIGDVVVPTTAAPTVRWAENHETRPKSRHHEQTPAGTGRRVGQQRPITQSSESLLFGDAFGLFFHFSWNPLREWNLPAHVVPGRRVFFSNLRNPSRRESVGYSD